MAHARENSKFGHLPEKSSIGAHTIQAIYESVKKKRVQKRASIGDEFSQNSQSKGLDVHQNAPTFSQHSQSKS